MDQINGIFGWGRQREVRGPSISLGMTDDIGAKWNFAGSKGRSQMEFGNEGGNPFAFARDDGYLLRGGFEQLAFLLVGEG
jgi:hypothetical protein